MKHYTTFDSFMQYVHILAVLYTLSLIDKDDQRHLMTAIEVSN